MDQDQENQDDSQLQHEDDDRQVEEDAPLLIQSPSGCLRIAGDGTRLQRGDGCPVKPTEDCSEPVMINVYDLHWINRVAKRFHLAAYHSGLEVHGVEIAYGECGVYQMTPRDATQMESKMTFKKSVQIGCTKYSRQDVKAISNWFGRNVYTSAMYDLLRRNCNHFSAALGRLLCPEAEIPRWVNSLAVKSVRLPLIERAIRHFMDGGEEDSEDPDDDGSGKSEKKKPRSGLRELSANLSRSSAAISGGKKQQAADNAEDADASCACEN